MATGGEKWYDASRFQKITARALNPSTLRRLSKSLNPPKTTITENSYVPDWTGLAECLGFDSEDIENFRLETDPTFNVIREWKTRENATIGSLFIYLEHDLERFDITTDEGVQKCVERDVENFIKRQEEKQVSSSSALPLQVPEVTPSYVVDNPDKYKINDEYMETDEYKYTTVGEVETHRPEYFDAYVSYTEGNISFVKNMIAELEESPNFNLKLCIDDRDLIPGTSYHTVTANLIEERCKRIVLVLCPEYLKSSQCDFQCKFAHSLSPGSRSKKLIPVLVEQCEIPPILRHITICDHTKTDLNDWFWKRLGKALEAPLKITDDDKFGDNSDELMSISISLKDSNPSSSWHRRDSSSSSSSSSSKKQSLSHFITSHSHSVSSDVDSQTQCSQGNCSSLERKKRKPIKSLLGLRNAGRRKKPSPSNSPHNSDIELMESSCV